MKKSGFTLIELMVYIAIMGIVVLVAGQAFSDSAKMRIRTQSMLSASETAGNVATLLTEDISQMGAKNGIGSINTTIKHFSFDSVYIDPSNSIDNKKDSSSFVQKENSFTFKRLRFLTSNSDTSSYAIEKVQWSLQDSILKRACWRIGGNNISTDEADRCFKDSATAKDSAVEIASGVANFEIKAAKPNVTESDSRIFPAANEEFMLIPRFGDTHYNSLNVVNTGSSSTLSGFASNFDKSENALTGASENPEDTERNQLFAAEYTGETSFNTASWKTACSNDANRFTLKAFTTYELSFNLTGYNQNMGMFVPGRDHLAVGFRNENGVRPSQIEDFLFYPNANGNTPKKRSMRFSVDATLKNECLVLTFVSYSPVTDEGSIDISDLQIKQVAGADLEFPAWDPEQNISDKKNVKAFKVSVKIKKNGEEGHVEQVILAASNGPRD